MDTEKILASLRSNLKALVLTEKNGYTVPKLYGHYKEFVGKDIREESRKLCFGSLEEFLDSQKDIIRRGYNNEGEQVYKGVADASTQHMATLVAKTPARKKKGSKSRGRGRGMRGSSGGMGGRGRVRGGTTGRVVMRGGFGRGGGAAGGGGALARGSGVPRQQENYYYHKNALEKYFFKNNLGEVPFKTSATGNRVSATVLVNGKEFKTFPQTFGTEAEAVEVVSKRCVLYLHIQKDGSIMKESSDKVMLVYRIEKLVANKINGLYATFIEKQYEKLYKEQLPSLWWEKIKSMNVVRVEPLAPGSDVMLVYPADQDSSTENVSNTISNSTNDNNGVNGKSEGEPHNLTEQGCQLPDLMPPNDSQWDVYVTAVDSAGEISLKFIGAEYSDRFDAMSDEMDIFYADSSIPPIQEFVQDRIYAACVSGGWHRVQVLNTDQVKTAVCLFIDDGDEDVVSIGDVKEIHPTFMEVAGQATYVSLEGLEEAIDDEDVTERLKGELVGKSLIALVKDAGNDNDLPSVVLIDTSGEVDVNINQMIINDWENMDESDSEVSSESDSPITKSLGILAEELDIIQRSIDLKQDGFKTELMPTKMLKIAEVNRNMKPMKTLKIPQINTDMDVTVVWTSSPSNFIVQPLEHVTSLENLMDDLCHYYNNPSNQVSITTGVAMGDFFAVKNSDKFWYRVRVAKLIDAFRVVVRFVDYGEVQIVGVGDLQPLVETFRELPCLAVQAKLAGVSSEWKQGEIFWFNERVVGGQFVSRVKRVETSLEGENVLELELIDTSDPYEDKYVAEDLLNWALSIVNPKFY